MFCKRYGFGSSCGGMSGEVIKPASRWGTVSSSYRLLQPSHPVFLPLLLGLPWQHTHLFFSVADLKVSRTAVLGSRVQIVSFLHCEVSRR